MAHLAPEETSTDDRLREAREHRVHLSLYSPAQKLRLGRRVLGRPVSEALPLEGLLEGQTKAEVYEDALLVLADQYVVGLDVPVKEPQAKEALDAVEGTI